MYVFLCTWYVRMYELLYYVVYVCYVRKYAMYACYVTLTCYAMLCTCVMLNMYARYACMSECM